MPAGGDAQTLLIVPREKVGDQKHDGAAMRDAEMLVSGDVTILIRLRAAKKLTGTAKNVPNVVASSAIKTVSMILAMVSSPF